MDSITILATTSTLSNVLNTLGRTTSSIVELRRQWRDADLTVLSLENQLLTLQTALGLIKEWIEQSSSSQFGFPELHHQLVMDLDRCIACCRLLITKIDAEVAQLQQSTVGDRPSKFTLLLKTRNLKKMQTIIQQQMTALTLLLTACNSVTISQQKELLENPQTRSVFMAMEDDMSSLFVHRNVDSLLASSSSSTSSSTSTIGSASRRSLKFDFDKQLFVSKIYERWIRDSPKRALWEQQPEPNKQKIGAAYVETRGNFSNEPVETDEKFVVDGNVFDVVETREKFITNPADTSEKFIVDGRALATVEARDKFIIDEMAESPYLIINDDSTAISNLGSLLTPKRTNNSSIKDKWKPLQLISPARKKSDSEKRSLAIDSSLRKEYRSRQQHNYKALLIGSESRFHILTAARMRDKKKEYTSQELDKYRDVILKTLRECTHVLIKEMRRVKINPDARYLWAYVDLIEGYYHDDDDCSGPAEELDERFFGALEAILQDPLIADLIRRSSSGQGGFWPRSADYFFAAVSRISSSNYVPTELDILLATTFSSTIGGIDKTEVRERGLSVDLLDIGGLVGKRGKWIHHFEAARFVIFVVDLDQCCDAEKMAETMRLLDDVVHSRWFVGASIILLLNMDIAYNSPRPDGVNGHGNSDIRKAAEHVVGRFQELNLDRLFVSPCNMTVNGGAAIQFILSVMKEAILVEALGESKPLI